MYIYIFWNCPTIFQKVCTILFPPVKYKNCSTFLPALDGLGCWFFFFNFSISNRWVVVSHCGFSLHFLMTLNIFSCVRFCHLYWNFQKYLFKYFICFCIDSFFFLLLRLKNYLNELFKYSGYKSFVMGVVI